MIRSNKKSSNQNHAFIPSLYLLLIYQMIVSELYKYLCLPFFFFFFYFLKNNVIFKGNNKFDY